jgi:hypothetical protein
MIILIQRLCSHFLTHVKSIVNYGCEVWGFHKGVDIETLHLSFLKRVLKVRKSSSNYMVYFELGKFPLLEFKQRVIDTFLNVNIFIEMTFWRFFKKRNWLI